MKHISLLIPEGDSSLSNLEATFKMFTMANSNLQRMGRSPLFRIQLVGTNRDARLSNGFFSISPDTCIADVPHTDLIIIPAIHGDYERLLEVNRDFIPWIRRQYENGAEVASLCIGAFLLARTGLLSGRHCATHWLAAQDFRKLYPDVYLVDDKVITDEDGIYTSGGAYSSLNLNLYLIEKFAGRDMAILLSKIFEIDIDRDSQSPFIIFKGQKDHQDDVVKEAQEFIEQRFQERITVTDLCERYGVGRRTFERRFKKATNNTVVEYIQRVKVEAAKKAFERSRKSVYEVMFDVGYSDSKAFRDVFRKHSGISPAGYRSRYNKNVIGSLNA